MMGKGFFWNEEKTLPRLAWFTLAGCVEDKGSSGHVIE